MRSRALNSRGVVTRLTAPLGVLVSLLWAGTAVFAQAPAPTPPAQHPMTEADKNKQLADQVAELRAQVAKLQAAVQQAAPANKNTPAAGMKMPPAPPKPMGMGMGMGMMEEKGEMGGMPPGGPGTMSPAPAAAMGMCCMGEMGAMPGTASGSTSGGAAPAPGGMAPMNAPSSAMPGQPGGSHLYHVGSTGFFLNHPQHITLTGDQKSALNRVKEKAMLDRSTGQRAIDQSEQELFILTGADQLDAPRVQAKIGEIEKQRAEQRMSFIKAVGEASKVLTHDQHQALMGTMAAGKK